MLRKAPWLRPAIHHDLSCVTQAPLGWPLRIDACPTLDASRDQAAKLLEVVLQLRIP